MSSTSCMVLSSSERLFHRLNPDLLRPDQRCHHHAESRVPNERLAYEDRQHIVRTHSWLYNEALETRIDNGGLLNLSYDA